MNLWRVARNDSEVRSVICHCFKVDHFDRKRNEDANIGSVLMTGLRVCPHLISRGSV